MTTGFDWSGRVGEVWAAEWSRTERAFSGLGPVLEQAILAAAPPSGRFLDIGCGVGSTSLAVARALPAAQVLGVDLAPGMIAVANRRAADQANVTFITADVLEWLDGTEASRDPGLAPRSRFLPDRSGEHEARIDLLFSRHGVMFFPDPIAAFRRLRKSAAPDAPLVFSCFAAPADNPWASLLTDPPPASGYAPGPFGFADEATCRTILVAAGWRAIEARRIDFRYLAGEGEAAAEEALALFTRIGPAASALRDASPAEKPALLDRLRARIAARAHGGTVDFPASAWLWSARA